MNRMTLIVHFTWFSICLTNAIASAEEPPGYAAPLFDGQTLEGWKVTGCEAVVENGALLLKRGDGFVRTDHRYGDFILELDWKALAADKWDSGIYIRSDLPPEGKPWPGRYQVNLLKGGEGNLIGVKGAESIGLVKDGDWNHFKLTVIGLAASLEINGKPAWKADGLEAPSGYIGFQSEVPLGGQFLFKEIRITELGFKSLFNGTDLAGWEGAGSKAEECWKVESGELLCTGQKGPWLRSKAQHGEFNMRLEYKLKEGGNSGVYVRVPEDGNHHGPNSGVEIQILDDASPRYANLQPYQFSGSVYAVAPAREHVSLPPGKWNRLEINCKGTDYRVYHNGVLIVDAKLDDFPALKERRLEGFLGLQNHSEEVWFRRLRLGPPQP